MAIPYAAEKQIAIAAVRRACVLTASVFNTLVKQETLTKDDSLHLRPAEVIPRSLEMSMHESWRVPWSEVVKVHHGRRAPDT